MTIRLRQIAPLLLGFVFLALVMAATFVMSVRQQADARAVAHTLTVRASINNTLSALQDAETGQRGYLLTGDAAYLAPYQSAVRRLAPELQRLTRLTADNPRQQILIARLRPLADAKLRELDLTIGMTRRGRPDLAVARIRTGVGKAIMDDARHVVADMHAEEARLLVQRDRDVAASGGMTRAVIVVALVLVAALALLSSYDNWRRVADLERSSQELSRSHTRLLAEGRARAAVEDQLRQSQKMEAIGQLTGGLAHDFNNMLAIIIGSLDLVRKRMERGDSNIAHLLDGAMDAATRAATVTHRLLAFSRQQPLSPQPLEPNRLVAGMSELLRRTLGDEVVIETVLGGGLWGVNADAGQLENAVLNLAINARDAMPGGGRLTIETANVYLDDAYVGQHLDIPPGQYVLLAVSDTGVGMSPEVIARAFDPFFTTKPVGKGTGLGLSQLHGFVRQSGGHVRIYSEPGQGTSVKLYFPRLNAPAASAAAEAAMDGPAAAAGRPDRIILVVEDEDSVRRMTVEALRDMNYTVVHAASGPRALEVLKAQPKIDLLFTDIVMPEMNGRQLADAAKADYPDLKVLFTTGYTRNAIVHNGMLDVGLDFIGKPFTLDQLARKVGEVLTD